MSRSLQAVDSSENDDYSNATTDSTLAPERHPLNEQAAYASEKEQQQWRDSSSHSAEEQVSLLRGNDVDSRPIKRERLDLRPYWLGVGLALVLFVFWLLDSLKDPVFAVLVGGDMDRHQPPAKLCSVLTTLTLVCCLEYLLYHYNSSHTTEKNERDSELRWQKMSVGSRGDSRSNHHTIEDDSPVSSSVFICVGVMYGVLFLVMSALLRMHSAFGGTLHAHDSTMWLPLAYAFYAMIESFGSVAVASFWSYTNSTLRLQDAEAFYGRILAIAQLGAFGGATTVTTHAWSTRTLLYLAFLVLALHVLVMRSYDRHFPSVDLCPRTTLMASNPKTSTESPIFSGVYLILRHNYVLLILGVSCLYEISLTCLDYQMKVLGWHRFQSATTASTSYAQFMGHFGQVTNLVSLFASWFGFPWLMRRLGLRLTLLVFPTLLCVMTLITYTALPGNLAALFVSMSILKATTYSIHDPAKEILYIPTSNAIKFRAKFWIDVVGERIAKAMGSTINTYAGSVEKSLSIASLPSVLTAVALWGVCARVGREFDALVRGNEIVGQSCASIAKIEYSELTQWDEEDELHPIGLSIDEEEDAFLKNNRPKIDEISL